MGPAWLDAGDGYRAVLVLLRAYDLPQRAWDGATWGGEARYDERHAAPAPRQAVGGSEVQQLTLRIGSRKASVRWHYDLLVGTDPPPF